MKKYLSVMLCFLSIINGGSALACGPSFLTPIFVMSIRPDNPESFVQGNIGILLPTFNRSVLFVAYRELNNLPFSASEQKDLLKNWNAEYEYTDDNESAKSTAIKNWLAARKKVLPANAEPKMDLDRASANGYGFFMNCTSSALNNAAKTLELRIKENSSSNDNVKAWLQAQDQVFANCSGTNTIPAEVKSNVPVWLKNDRDYQIAAAYFYATQYDEAEKRFAAIAQNKASAWHELSAYLLARVAIRQASAVLSDTKLDEKAQQSRATAYYQQAEKQLNNILADKNLAAFQGAARQLLNLVNFRIHPETLHDTLAKKLLTPTENPQFFQDLTDYRWLLDKAVISENPDNSVVLLQKNIRQHDLTDWIFTMQTNGKDAYTHALEKWHATKTPAWLLASLSKADKDSTELSNLMTAGQSIAKNSPAFLSVNYHLARLQLAQGQTDESRKLIDSILSDSLGTTKGTTKKLQASVSTTNEFLALRLILSQNLDEFVQFSQRHAAAFSYDGDNYQLVDLSVVPKEGEDYLKNERIWMNRSLFDVDAAYTMNKLMPLALLKRLAQPFSTRTSLPDYLKTDVLISAWTRALLLNDEKSAVELAAEMAKAQPELKGMMLAFITANNAKNRLAESSWILLNNPAIRPVVDSGLGRQVAFNQMDNYGDNWWCKSTDVSDATRTVQSPIFLSKAELDEANAENIKILQVAASGENYVAAQTSLWAKLLPDDKRLPHALYLAVNATRGQCRNCDTGKISKTAFDILKSRFANTSWKKKTPYWYKDASCDQKAEK